MNDTRATIRSIATDLFFQQGYFATSISAIARGCGIQKASIYYHFPGKEDLLYDIMAATMNELVNNLEALLAGIDDVEARVRAAVNYHVGFHLKHQKETFIASSELRGLNRAHHKLIVAQRDAYEKIFQDLIKEGIDRNIFAPGDIKILSYAILTLCTAGASWYRPDGRLDIGDIAAIYENFILNGLKSGHVAG